MQATSPSSSASASTETRVFSGPFAEHKEPTLRPLTTPETLELWLLQLGLMLLGTYFAMGVVTKQAYAWPLLMGPGPFFPVLCVYLGCQLQRPPPHLYAMVRLVTVYSVPFATITLVRGYLMGDAADPQLHVGQLPPLLLYYR